MCSVFVLVLQILHTTVNDDSPATIGSLLSHQYSVIADRPDYWLQGGWEQSLCDFEYGQSLSGLSKSCFKGRQEIT